jgi:2-succinyl-6-hydroxy-2,4-cyclohexadiene-1-carboxylate synthase
MREVTETLVLLHGFAGTHRGWDDVVARLDRERYRPLALDLRGHGAARDLRPISFAACARDVLDAAPARFALAGYSLGGRVALHVALAAPQRVTGLALISTTAGIEDEAARASRRRDDDALTRELLRPDAGIDAFARRWSTGPLFAEDPPGVQAAAVRDIRRNDPSALAAALDGLGAGAMPPLWPRLAELTVPAVVMAGARDTKYVAIAERLAAALPRAALSVIPRAGHALPREAPAALAAVLNGPLGQRADTYAPS